MKKVYIINVTGCDDYEFPEDSFYAQVTDSVWSSKKAAKNYINRLSSYTLYGKTYRFRCDVESEGSERCVEVANWFGFGDNLYISFDIDEVEVRS